MEREKVRAKSHPTVGREFDPQRLAQLGRVIIGERTVLSFSEERGISRSLVSRIVNGTLTAPPRIRSLYLFAGEDKEMADELLLACGYSAGVVAHLKEMPRLLRTADAQKPAETCVSHLDVTPPMVLAGVLDALTYRGYGDQFKINYARDGIFSIQLETGHNLIAVPAIVTQDIQRDTLWKSVLQRMGFAILSNDEIARNLYVFVTNDDRFYDRLKCLPNMGSLMSILKIENGKISKQHIIAPSGATAEEEKAFEMSYPILFTD